MQIPHTIYAITNLNNGKLYIGKTKRTLGVRWREHVRPNPNSPTSKTYFCRAIKKHGMNAFVVEQIDTAKDLAEANELEKLYIGIFNSWRRQYGYNTALGGDGIIPNEATRKKEGQSRSGSNNFWYGTKGPMFGKKLSREARDKISAANRRRTYHSKRGKDHYNYAKIDDVFLIKLYVEDNLTLEQAGAMLGISQSASRRHLMLNGVVIRPDVIKRQSTKAALEENSSAPIDMSGLQASLAGPYPCSPSSDTLASFSVAMVPV